MTALVKRWYRSRRNQLVTFIVILFCIIYYISLNDSLHREPDLDITRSLNVTLAPVKRTPLAPAKYNTGNESLFDFKKRASVLEYIETKLEEALREDKGTGCEFPQLDPFGEEVTQFDRDPPRIICDGRDWVRCYLSECRVVKEILDTTRDIRCEYRDIVHISDRKHTLGPPTTVAGDGVYTLTKSDHVKVKCVGKHKDSVLPSKWAGNAIGFRTRVERKKPPAGRADSIDVLILGFDSTSKNGFIRRMPKSYKYISEQLGATILNGYNIVGDGTPAALFPILTGKTELELPDVRHKSTTNGSLDDMPFIFYKLKEDGYRTAYFEDMPWIGTFQYRFKGFKRQPADHYLRSFYLEEFNEQKKWWKSKTQRYCIGDTLNYKLMLNVTQQFFKLDGKHFAFTFIADITHDDFNMISIADEDTMQFLKAFKESGWGQTTMLLMMGDHGPRYAKVRNTIQGKFEERLPLMAIRLPEVLNDLRPEVAATLEYNANVLTTPHDIHATILDAMGLQKYLNNYKIKGADLTRALTLFETIPRNRSCSEAGVEPHWCACVAWRNVSQHDEISVQLANKFVRYINSLTEPLRSKCVPRTLTKIMWVMKRKANNKMLTFVGNKDGDGYVGKFKPYAYIDKDYYQIKVEVGPGNGVYEASVAHFRDQNKFVYDTRDISRINPYNNEPRCISAKSRHLNMFCYCKEFLKHQGKVVPHW